MKQEIPLLEDELAALDNDVAAIDRLCRRLADVPSPAGPTPTGTACQHHHLPERDWLTGPMAWRGERL